MEKEFSWIDERPTPGSRLNEDNLLRDYARISSRRRGAAIATARRAQSTKYLDILATEASGGPARWEQVRSDLLRAYTEGGFGRMRTLIRSQLKAKVIGEIGNFLLLSSQREEEQQVGLIVLRAVLGLVPYDREVKKWRRNCVQALILQKRDSEALSLLNRWKSTDNLDRGYLRAELKNPYRFGTGINNDKADFDEWVENFNRRFVVEGISPVTLELSDKKPFDRLTATADRAQVGHNGSSPIVSVVMTSFRPSRDELETSVRSILRQTVQELELIIVDDASGPEYRDLFKEVAGWDSRIRIETMPENVGTYVCRNRGLMLAEGVFYTGQDDDDWSHPQRIEHQLREMIDATETVACRVDAVRCAENLGRVFLGYSYRSGNASSLMVRTNLMRDLGGFIPVRKAADTELARRIEIATGREVVTIDKPLTVVRILSDSLSRSDFSAGWSHPTRDSFKSAYSLWHSNSDSSELRLDLANQESVPIFSPQRIRGGKRSEESAYDVVLAGDWKKLGGPQKSMLEELRALLNGGYKVAVMHMEAARFMRTQSDNLNEPIQSLLNSGQVDQVFYDDEAIVRLLVLRYPPILQFPPDKPSNLKVKKMVVLANQAPSELDGSDIRYLVPDCTENARFMFDSEVLWAPQGPQVRKAIEPFLDESELSSFDLPGIVNPTEWRRETINFTGRGASVIGRHSRDDQMKWPELPEDLLAAYPTNSWTKVRAMGGGDTPRKVLGQKNVPTNWELLNHDQEGVKEFLHSLDFYVFFQHSRAIEAFGRSILEAIASDLVVVLPPHYEEVFGDAAVYCTPREVEEVVDFYRKNPSEYFAQIERARSTVSDNFAHSAYLSRIEELLTSK